MKKFCQVLIPCLLCSGFVNSQAFFENVASTTGLNLTTGNSIFGSGVLFCNYNNDGWDDITLGTESGHPVRFFKNVNGNFTEDFFNITLVNSQTKQVIWADYDNDGDKDLYVASNTSGNQLYRNNGGSNFTDVTSSSGLPTTNIFTFGAVWGDYDNDGYLDLFLANKDTSFTIPNYLYKNNGDGTFTDKSIEAGILPASTLALCATFFDYNNDGWQDIYVSNDRPFIENTLYKNNGDGTFDDVSAASNTNVSIDAMTTTIGDYNQDGWFDLYVTNTADGNVFFRNNGDGTFTDLAPANGTLFNSICWGAVFLDADLDTDLDLYVSASTDGSFGDLSAAFYENDGLGMYTIPTTAGFSSDNYSSYSNAVGDVDNNGMPDFVVNNSSDDNVSLWKNLTFTTGNWLKIKLEGVDSNRDGIGSVIEISINGVKQFRYTGGGEGYLAQNSSTEFLGIGNATSVDYVKVTWLSGTVDLFNDVGANQLLEIQEGAETLSLEDLDGSLNIEIFPNPTSSHVFLNSESEITNINISNALGQTVLSEKIDFGFKTSIDMTTFSSGIYYLTVSSGEKKSMFKVIKE